jgi:multidrug resistance efflux pump
LAVEPASEAPRAAANDELEALAFPKRSRRTRALMGTAGLGGLVVLALLLRPVPTSQTVPCTLEVVQLGELSAPFDGVASFELADGAEVQPGDVVARVVARDSRAEITALEQKVASLADRLAKLRSAPAPKVARVKQQRKVARAQVEALTKVVAKLVGLPSPAAKRKLAAVEAALRAKQALLVKLEQALEALSHERARAELNTQLTNAQTALATARRPVQPATVTAAAGGLLRLAAPGEVKAGASLGAVLRRALRVAGAQAPAEKSLVRVGEQQFVTSTDLAVDAPHSLAGQACVLEIPAGRTAWLLAR